MEGLVGDGRIMLVEASVGVRFRLESSEVSVPNV